MPDRPVKLRLVVDAEKVTAMIASVPNKPRTPHRTIRVPDDLWDAARAKADERGENLSEVLRAALERYVKRR